MRTGTAQRLSSALLLRRAPFRLVLILIRVRLWGRHALFGVGGGRSRLLRQLMLLLSLCLRLRLSLSLLQCLRLRLCLRAVVHPAVVVLLLETVWIGGGDGRGRLGVGASEEGRRGMGI